MENRVHLVLLVNKVSQEDEVVLVIQVLKELEGDGGTLETLGCLAEMETMDHRLVKISSSHHKLLVTLETHFVGCTWSNRYQGTAW